MPNYATTRLRATPPCAAGVPISGALNRFLERFQRRVFDGARSAETLGMHEANARWLQRQLGSSLPIDELTTGFLEAFSVQARDRGGEDGAPLHIRTVAKRFTTLRQALRLAHRLGQLSMLPEMPEFFQPPEEHEGPILRSWEEVKALLAHLRPERRDWVSLCLWTGQHASDVERTTWREVDLQAGWIVIRNTKNRKPKGRRVRMPAPLLAALTERVQRLACAGKSPLPGDPVVRPWKNRSYVLPAACVRAGLQPMNATALRHSAVSFMIRRTGITVTAQKWFGWSNFKMMERVYAHALPPQLEDGARELESIAEEDKA